MEPPPEDAARMIYARELTPVNVESTLTPYPTMQRLPFVADCLAVVLAHCSGFMDAGIACE
jgi:hypothetical protein